MIPRYPINIVPTAASDDAVAHRKTEGDIGSMIPLFTEEAPNAETATAMEAARCGEGADFATLDELFADLNAPDHL